MGGIDLDPDRRKGPCLPFNGATGGLENPNVAVEQAQACYAKSIMKAAGVPDDRLDVRVRDVPTVDQARSSCSGSSGAVEALIRAHEQRA